MQTKVKKFTVSILASFIVVELIGYLWHRFAAHLGYAGDTLRVTHQCHHETVYPHSDLESEEYRTAHDNWPWLVPMIVVVLIVYLLYKKYEIVDKETMILFVIVAFIYVNITFFFHNSYHVKNHWLTRYKWYVSMKKTHFIHHYDNCNYGIVFSFMDRLFGTYCSNSKIKKDIFNGFQSTCNDRIKSLDWVSSTL